VSRGFLLSFIALGLALALLFAAYPSWDMQVAEWFFDPSSAKFPLAVDDEWRPAGPPTGCPSFSSRLPASRSCARLPERADADRPVDRYLLGSFLIGPGLTSNLLLKENWGRPRPNSVQQFAGTAAFQPWWRPACRTNQQRIPQQIGAFWDYVIQRTGHILVLLQPLDALLGGGGVSR
jgi:hypothetical protein